MTDLHQFIHPYSRYHGQVKPENLVFNANLQEFSQRVSLICSLESNGKLSPEESYEEIKSIWEQLQRSKRELGIGKNPFHAE